MNIDRAKLLKYTTVASAIISALLSIAYIVAGMPGEYAAVAVAWTGGLLAARKLIVRIGDALDDGKVNDSFEDPFGKEEVFGTLGERTAKSDGVVKTPLQMVTSADGVRRGTLPGSTLAFALLLCLALPSCSTFTEQEKQDAKEAGVKVGLAAAEAALVVAQMQLTITAEDMARSEGGSASERLAKQLALAVAQQALAQAQAAVARERAKVEAQELERQRQQLESLKGDKQPLNVGPPSGKEPLQNLLGHSATATTPFRL